MSVLFRIYFDLIRLHINITTDCVLNLSELTLVCLTKTLVESEKLVTDRYKKVLLYKINVSARINQRQKDIYIYIYIYIYIFLQKNDSNWLFIDLLSINFNLLSVLLHYAFHQISDYEMGCARQPPSLSCFPKIEKHKVFTCEQHVRL